MHSRDAGKLAGASDADVASGLEHARLEPGSRVRARVEPLHLVEIARAERVDGLRVVCVERLGMDEAELLVCDGLGRGDEGGLDSASSDGVTCA